MSRNTTGHFPELHCPNLRNLVNCILNFEKWNLAFDFETAGAASCLQAVTRLRIEVPILGIPFYYI